MSSDEKNLFFVVEGNIGTGKSTFLKIIKQYLNVNIIYEPHNRWQNVDGENILDYFYKAPQRWAYTFQTYAFVTRLQELKSKLNNSTYSIMERSIYSDRYCFAKNCYEMGTINSLEWKLYKDLFTNVTQLSNLKPAGFIYLQADPQVCYKRILKRNRPEEINISLNYLELLHKKHEDWLINKEDVEDWLKNVPVLTINCNEEFENNILNTKKNIIKIIDFFDKEYGIPNMERPQSISL